MTTNSKLNWELAKEYYKLAPKSSFSFFALLTIVAYFYWGEIPAAILLPWLGVNFVGASLFLIATRQFKRHGTEENADRWLRIYSYLVFIQDVPFGVIGPISFIIDNDVYRMLTLFMLGGMTAGAIVTRAILFKYYLISLFSLLLPIAFTLAFQRTAIAQSMFALVLIYLVFMLSVAKNYSATINRNILLWLDNEQLVNQLRSSNAEVEETNRVLIREIDYRKEIERELVEAKERSERANEAKSQFLATVSHELRTPLNGIMGFADLLQAENLVQTHQHFVGQISKSAQTLLRIVNDILDITAIEAGQVRFHEEPFSLRSEVEDLLDMLLPMAAQKQLVLEWQVDEAVEDNLYGDANRLRQILSNLLSNAVKYTEVGRVSLTVSRLETQLDEVVLRFAVEDTGIGIAPDALSTVFDNFTRVENFETRRTEGVGLGLAIVKTLVQKMDGKLAVRSIPGEGSCFSFELPFAPSLGVAKQTRRIEAPELTPAQWQTFNVLVVDDNDVNRMVLTAFLSKTGIPFVEASNGYEALDCIRRGDFDVVLLDIQMPDISGIEVARRLREDPAPMPVLIAVTAHAFPEQRQAILDAGFCDFLIKPISIGDLLNTLTQVYIQSHNEHKVHERTLQV